MIEINDKVGGLGGKSVCVQSFGSSPQPDLGSVGFGVQFHGIYIGHSQSQPYPLCKRGRGELSRPKCVER